MKGVRAKKGDNKANINEIKENRISLIVQDRLKQICIGILSNHRIADKSNHQVAKAADANPHTAHHTHSTVATISEPLVNRKEVYLIVISEDDVGQD